MAKEGPRAVEDRQLALPQHQHQREPPAALDESKAFLDKYYTSNFSMKFVEGFTTAEAQQCIDELKAYFAAGIERTLPATSWDQHKHLKRFLNSGPALK